MNTPRAETAGASDSSQVRTQVLPDGPAKPPSDELELARFALLGTGRLPSKPNLTLARHLAFLPHDALTLDLTDPEQRDFGDYELEAHLGQGGMGVVYRARQKSLDREVAVKLLAAGPWASVDFIEQFRREARSAARMAHPNIVPIYEIGQWAELNFYAMRLVRGPSLAAVLASDGALEPRAAATLMQTVAEAVDYAHRLGVLHLDLKPGNLLIDENGAPQVADFGLARQLDETLSAEATEVSGTPSYMAPEQAELRRHRLSPATDIYGLGAILFEVLTGRPPFIGGSAQETLQRLLAEEPPRLRQLNRAIPVDLEAICLKCLAKDPSDRYPSARALADDLGRFHDGRPVSVRRPGVRERLARWVRREPRVALSLLAFVLALLAGLVATALQWRRADANALTARTHLWESRAQTAQAALAEGDSFRGLRGLVANLAEMEADGRLEEAARERRRIGTVLAQSPRLLRQFALPDQEFASAVALSPDGRRLAVATAGNRSPRQVREYELADGRLRWQRSTEALTQSHPMAQQSPHGRLFYRADGRTLLAFLLPSSPFAAPMWSDAIQLDTASGAPLLPPAELGPYADVVHGPLGRLALMRFRSDASQRFPDSLQLVALPGWTQVGPRRKASAFAGSVEWLFGPDESVVAASGDFTQLTLHETPDLMLRWRFALPSGDLLRAWCFSPDGRLLALGSLKGAVWLLEVATGQVRALPSGLSGIVRTLVFEHDGSTLAAITDNRQIAAWDVVSARLRTQPIAAGMHQEGPVLQLRAGELWSSDANEVRSWTLTPLAPYGNQALPAAARIRGLRRTFPHAIDRHVGANLLVHADMSGRVSLWQMPPSALLPASWRAAPLADTPLRFDGQSIVTVAGARVQLRDPRTQAPRSPVFVHPAPVQVAALDHTGRRLFTVADRTLRALDPGNGVLAGTAIRLPETPFQVLIARASSQALLLTATPVARGQAVRLHRFDLDRGQLQTLERTLAGPLRQLELSPDGRLAYVLESRPAGWQPGQAVPRARIIDLADGSDRCTELGLADETNQGQAAFAADGRSLWFHASGTLRQHFLVHWDLASCRELGRVASTQGGETMRPIAVPSRVVANRFGNQAIGVVEVGGQQREVNGLPRAQLLHAFAVSADGRQAAQAVRDAVQIIDLEDGQRLSAQLAVPLAGNDAIAELAFAPDGSHLLGRSVQGRWLHWALPGSTAAIAQLRALAATLDPDTLAQAPPLVEAQPAATPPAASWPSAELVLAAVPESLPLPQLEPLDLSAIGNAALDGSWPDSSTMRGDALSLAPGLQRWAGIDWHLSRVLQLSGGQMARALQAVAPDRATLHFAAARLARVHLLSFEHIPARPDAPPRVLVTLRLGAVDGSTRELSVRSKQHVVTNWQPEQAHDSARIAFSTVFPTDIRAGEGPAGPVYGQAYAVSLDVPADWPTLQSLELAVPPGNMEVPLVYAITLEHAHAR